MESLSVVFIAASVTGVLVVISTLLYYLSTQSASPFTPSVLAVDSSSKKGKKVGKGTKDVKKKKKAALVEDKTATSKPSEHLSSNDHMYSETVRPHKHEKQEKMLQLEIDAEVIEPSATGVRNKSWKSLADGEEEPRSILKNRDEPIQVAPANSNVQLPHWKHPKDEIELSYAHRVGQLTQNKHREETVPAASEGKKKKKNKKKVTDDNELTNGFVEVSVRHTSEKWSTVSSSEVERPSTKPSEPPVSEAHSDAHILIVAPAISAVPEKSTEVSDVQLTQPKGPSKQVLELESRIKKMHVQIQKRDSQISELQQRIADAITPLEMQRLKSELNRKTQETAEHQKKSDILQAQFANNVSELMAGNRQQDTLKHSLEMANQEKNMAIAEIERINGVLLRKEMELTDLNKHRMKVAAESKAHQETEQRLQVMTADKNNMQTRFQTVEQELRQLQQISLEKDEELKSVKQELFSSLDSAKFRESGEGQEDIATSEYQANLTALKTQVGELESQVNQLMQDIEQEKSTNSDLKSRLETAHTEAQNREAEWRQQSNIVSSLQSQIDTLHYQNSCLLDNSGSVAVIEKRLRSSLDEFVAEKKSAAETLEAVRGELSTASEQLSSSQQTVRDLETKLSDLEKMRQDDSVSLEENKRLKEELGQTQERCVTLEKDVENSKVQLKEYTDGSGDQDNVQQLRDQLESSEKERDELLHQLEDQKNCFETQRKTVIDESESVLHKLQQSVEEEAVRLKGLISQSESECHQIKEHSDAKITELQTRLEESEKLHDQLKVQVNELSESLSQAQSASNNSESEQQKTTSELVDQNTRLTELLKEAQDALQTENDIVADLRKQIASSPPSADCQQQNGPMEPTPSSHCETQES